MNEKQKNILLMMLFLAVGLGLAFSVGAVQNTLLIWAFNILAVISFSFATSFFMKEINRGFHLVTYGLLRFIAMMAIGTIFLSYGLMSYFSSHELASKLANFFLGISLTIIPTEIIAYRKNHKEKK
ncbi:hypothetical protein C4573_03380 [Candidatus Woesearchaeota archaeon]|nr:MAG: hypothetical protein C4573_03380 [Candidatus Woesearchaeota archaeon]